jgi:hypothetical protein
MGKNHLTVHVDNDRVYMCKIHFYASTATKQLHLNLISKLILRFALLLKSMHDKERCHVKLLIPYTCRLSSPLSSSSKTLSKHIFSAPIFRFCFHPIHGAVGIRETTCRAILELPNRAHLYTIASG